MRRLTPADPGRTPITDSADAQAALAEAWAAMPPIASSDLASSDLASSDRESGDVIGDDSQDSRLSNDESAHEGTSEGTQEGTQEVIGEGADLDIPSVPKWLLAALDPSQSSDTPEVMQ
jgi:hypothetical protein